MSPRTKEQLNILKSEKRTVILEAGLKIFSHSGYEAASISLIASQAGISKGLMYAYFKSKEDLLKTLLFDALEDMFKISLDAITDNPTDIEFEEMIKVNFTWIKENKEYAKIYFGLLFQSSVMEIFKDEIMILAQPVFKSVSQYFLFKGFKNPMVETRFFLSMLDGVIMNYIIDEETYPIHEVEQKIIAQYIK